MKKKLLALIMALAMTLVLTACGGAADQGAAEEPSGEEPNTGCGAVVFTVPDGWTMAEATPGTYSHYTIPDSGYRLVATVFNEESLKNYNDWAKGAGKDTAESVEAYYKSNTNMSEDELKEKNLEQSKVEVCGTEGNYVKYTGGKDGYYELSTSWLQDGDVYQLYMYSDDTYDKDGKLNEKAAALTDDEIAKYESVVASVQPGDGTVYQNAFMEEAAKSLGSITFDIPEGYSVLDAYRNMVTFQKEGTGITLQISCTREDELGNFEVDGETPASLQDFYDRFKYEDMETTTIAGFEGHVDKWPAEDDNYYNVSASFLADDAVYDIYMGTDAYDEEGNLKENAEKLSEDDLAAFDAFIASLKKK